jgi:hypothetical protein
MKLVRIGLIIADFEMNYSTSFQNTARRKFDVDFDTSNVDSISDKLSDLRYKVENKIQNEVHVGFEITLEHVIHLQELLQKILNRYIELFGRLPVNRKIYTINDKLREAEIPTAKELAKEIVGEIIKPKTEKLTRAERLKIDAEAKSQERALKLIQKNRKNNK